MPPFFKKFYDISFCFPNNTALSTEENDKFLTYAEFLDSVEKTAYYLINKNIKKGDFVVVIANKSPLLYVYAMALMRIGAIYVPVDPTYPLVRIQYILDDCQPGFVLYDDFFQRCLADLKITMGLHAKLETCAYNSPALAYDVSFPQETDLAYMIYTSGTTGNPKGVKISYEGLPNCVISQEKICGLNEKDSVLQYASISFDASIFEWVGALLTGARLCIPNKNKLLVGTELEEIILSFKITYLVLPPSVLMTLGVKDYEIKTIISAGESLPSRLANAWYNKVKLINAYGPTETTVCATMYHVNGKENSDRVPIGIPIENTSVLLLDQFGQDVAIGEIGEIYLSGVNLSKGYLNLPALTQEKFFLRNSVLLYKTGDLGFKNTKGDLVFVGRVDEQIKIRGHRVELIEIEICLIQHELIQAAVVRLNLNIPESPILEAFVLPEKNARLSREMLNDYIRMNLPVYMHPNKYYLLTDYPRTIQGKIDKESLELSAILLESNAATVSLPPTGLKTMIKQAWADVLHCKKEEIKDDISFFEIGGTSLNIVKLIKLLSDVLTVNIKLRDFLQFPTPNGLEQLLASRVCERQFLLEEDIDRNSDLIERQLIEEDIACRWAAIDFPAPLHSKKPEHILLTGATGFIGSAVLKRILARSDVQVTCIIRNNSDQLLLDYFNNKIKKYGMEISPDQMSRCCLVKGDLTKKFFDLTEDQYTLLASSITVVCHAAAHVNHIYNYEALRFDNVVSTKNIIHFSLEGRRKKNIYVSALSAVRKGKNIPESYVDQSLMSSTLSGYEKTKWTAEQLYKQAGFLGLDVFIIRPCLILGTRKHRLPKDSKDHLLSLIHGCVQLGAYPTSSAELLILSVDFLSKCIDKLIFNTSLGQYIFNAIPQEIITWNQFMSKQQPNLKPMLFADWRRSFLPSLSELNAIYPFLSLYQQTFDRDFMWSYDVQKENFERFVQDNHLNVEDNASINGLLNHNLASVLEVNEELY